MNRRIKRLWNLILEHTNASTYDTGGEYIEFANGYIIDETDIQEWIYEFYDSESWDIDSFILDKAKQVECIYTPLQALEYISDVIDFEVYKDIKKLFKSNITEIEELNLVMLEIGPNTSESLNGLYYLHYKNVEKNVMNIFNNEIHNPQNEVHVWNDHDDIYSHNAYHTGYVINGYLFDTGYTGVDSNYWGTLIRKGGCYNGVINR